MNGAIRLATKLVPLVLAAASLHAGTLILKRAWVEKFRNRATIDVNFIIDKAHKNPNSAKEDGDLHIAGRAPKEVGLPMVAELVNAGLPIGKTALALVRTNTGVTPGLKMSGVWRLWFEHPGHMQVQFDDVPPAGNTNPDHSFEIHPVTRYGDEDLTPFFADIKDYDTRPATKVFESYNKHSVTIRATKTAVTLDAKKAVYNYVRFRIRLVGKPKSLDDGGLSVLANVFDPASEEEEPVAEKIRMIFVKDTAPWKLISGKDEGDSFNVLGIPRVNLVPIFALIKDAGTGGVTRKLPYEMIIVDAAEPNARSGGGSARPRR